MIVDWDDAYANAPHIQGGAEYPAQYEAKAAAFRERMEGEGRAELDIAYGDADREKYDLFRPAGEAHGLAAFIHGGYWRAFDKSIWSHLAAGAVARGWAVAMPSYTLAPNARISQITRQVGAAIEAAAKQVEGPVTLSGHSAGGHLATRMICRDTPLSKAVSARIRRVVSISGVHDLRPLMMTQLNEMLQLDEAEAIAESPALNRPVAGARLMCWVGGDERPEFLRQNDLLANVWTGLGADASATRAPGRHHFDVIEDLENAESMLSALVAG